MRKRWKRLILMPGLLASCASVAAPEPAPVPVHGHPGMFYLPAKRMEGDLNLSPRTYEFQGCNFTTEGEAGRVLAPLVKDQSRTYRFRVKMIARRTPARAPGLRGFGHLSLEFSCQIQAVRFISIEELPHGR